MSSHKRWLAMWRDIGQAVFFHHVSGYNLVLEARKALSKRTKHAPGEGSDGWCTPAWLAELLGDFDWDPCTNDRSHIQARVLDYKDDDGLLLWKWVDMRDYSVFCNPPYSNVLHWAQRLVKHQGPWCALLKYDTTTAWWAELMKAKPTVAPFRKRIKFESGQGGDTTANFPSVLVYANGWEPSDALKEHLWVPTN